MFILGTKSLKHPNARSGSVVKNLPAEAGNSAPWVRKIPWKNKWQPTSIFLPGKSYGQRSLVGYGPWGSKESDVTE